ncbi:unnamed protein product [Notodromas monacha]|uniref:Dehydrogenase/reductase SDR family member 4 n=1 Tax=Notodromas monacha TaxID=399045 RepID=A0A7R9BUC3_9CRUS|nr:unnamed protein product [Notodromas monacha]CAG0920348.1 unnamed protein product [Notodromas monacha]
MSVGTLAGKVAIVTASTEGIGLAIAKRLGKDGAKVVISSRKRSNVDKAVEELKRLGVTALGCRCHVGHDEQRRNMVQAAVDQFGGIDILVSNAAVNPFFGNMMDCPEDSWNKIFDVNVKASWLLTREVVPHMIKRGSGAIVFVTSIAGYTPMPMLGPYSVSKTALLGLVKAFAHELANDNIRVNAVAPGVVRTKFSSALTDTEGLSDALLTTVPMRRFGETDEIAGTVSFLCSKDASYVTGETMVVAGGMNSKL